MGTKYNKVTNSKLKLTICGEKKMSRVFSLQPPDFVDFLFDFQALKVVKLWFMALEGGIHIVFTTPWDTCF